MQNIAPLGYEQYAVLTNLFQKYGIESVAVEPQQRMAEPAGAVNTDVARRRGTAARGMTDGNAVAPAKTASAASGRYPEYRLSGQSPANLALLGKTLNGIGDMADMRPVRPAREVTALYERADTILKATALPENS